MKLELMDVNYVVVKDDFNGIIVSYVDEKSNKSISAVAKKGMYGNKAETEKSLCNMLGIMYKRNKKNNKKNNDNNKVLKNLNNNVDYVVKENAITKFRKEFSFLSNMYNYKTIVPYNGFTFNSVETAYHAQKDPSRAKEFAEIIKPGFAKIKGSNIKNLRSDWDEVKDNIMEELVRIKFNNNERLKLKLLETGDRELVEGNDHGDTYWGVFNGKGLNKLGLILMKIREEIREKNKI